VQVALSRPTIHLVSTKRVRYPAVKQIQSGRRLLTTDGGEKRASGVSVSEGRFGVVPWAETNS
jgi:hypothetical protein